jgi:hypothetical protein
MAYTASSLVKTVWGNKNVQCWRMTADAASGTLSTGFVVVESVIGIGARSCTTTGFRTFPNGTAASAACNGVVGFSGLVSGDVFEITVIGR